MQQDLQPEFPIKRTKLGKRIKLKSAKFRQTNTNLPSAHYFKSFKKMILSVQNKIIEPFSKAHSIS